MPHVLHVVSQVPPSSALVAGSMLQVGDDIADVAPCANYGKSEA